MVAKPLGMRAGATVRSGMVHSMRKLRPYLWSSVLACPYLWSSVLAGPCVRVVNGSWDAVMQFEKLHEEYVRTLHCTGMY